MYLITGPEENSQFCFLKNLCFPRQWWGDINPREKQSPKGPVIKGLFTRWEGYPTRQGNRS